jgi:hypothetical protein
MTAGRARCSRIPTAGRRVGQAAPPLLRIDATTVSLHPLPRTIRTSRVRALSRERTLMRSGFLAIVAALAFASPSTAATCRNHVTGKLRSCAPRIMKHPVVRHRAI